MEYTRTIKFKYFQIKRTTLKENEWSDPSIFDFGEFLATLVDKKMETKTQEIEHIGLKYRIEKINTNAEHGLWYVKLMKLRDTNIPSKVKENEKAEPVELEDDEYIGEDVSFLYERKSGIVMFQMNRFSISVNKLQEILFSLNGKKNERFVLEPISFVVNKKELKHEYYKKIDISFANLFNAGLDKNSPLGGIINSCKKAGGISAHITISLGHSKQETLNREIVQNIIDEAREMDRSVKVKGKVTVKDDDDTKPEIIDLFDNISNDLITFTLKSRETLQYEDVYNKMVKVFLYKRDELYALLGIEGE